MPNKLEPTTIRRKIAKLNERYKLLEEKKGKITVQINEIELKIKTLQTRCSHHKKTSDECYDWCDDCGAAVGADGTIIPDHAIDYPE